MWVAVRSRLLNLYVTGWQQPMEPPEKVLVNACDLCTEQGDVISKMEKVQMVDIQGDRPKVL